MKVSTKTLSSLLLVAAAKTVRRDFKRRKDSRYERMLQKHDRKGELRASVLGMKPADLRILEKRKSFREIVRSCGFRDEDVFRTALLGKIKNELHLRGWTFHRIDDFIAIRSNRLT